MKPKFAISVMCMDFLNLKKQIEFLNNKCDYFHFDIMDGHFCPNIMLPPSLVKILSPSMKKPVDAHLMVEHPQEYLEDLAKDGADFISLHAETINPYAFRLMDRIEEPGCKVGITLNPATPISSIKHYLHRIDMLTIMTVDVGFSGSKFIEEMLEKIEEAAVLKKEKSYKYIIQVDGACNEKTFAKLAKAGAESYVMGNTGLFKYDPDIEKAYDMFVNTFYKEAGEYYE